MKKIFTLVAAALVAVAVNAQDVEQLGFKIDDYPWNYTADPGTDVKLTFSSQWGEFGLIGASNAINPADYKGYRIEYVADPSTAGTDDDGNPSYVQTSIGGVQYNDFDANASVLEQDFSDAVKALSSLDKFNVQAKVKDAKIEIKSFTLVKADGTEVPVTSYVAGGWGRSLGSAAAPVITFTGQYGGLCIYGADEQPCTYSHATEENVVYLYSIKAAEPIAKPTLVELDNASGGFQYFNFDADLDQIDFTVSHATAVKETKDEDGTVTASEPNDVAKIYFKNPNEGTDPFTVKVTSVSRIKTTVDGIENVNAKETLHNAVNAPMYNLAGQQVSKNYKGVVIQNGKKFFNK